MNPIRFFNARNYAGYLGTSVDQDILYDGMAYVLRKDIWKSYVNPGNGRSCSFTDVADFLTHEDGLGIRDLSLFLTCLHVVAASDSAVAARADDLLLKLQKCGLDVDPAPMLRRMIDRRLPVAGRKRAGKVGASWASHTRPCGLLSRKEDLQLTALQALLLFFEYDKGGDVGQYYLEGLSKILTLLPECDWSECHPDGWVALDWQGHKKSLTVTPKMLADKHLRPLLAALDQARDELQALVEQIDGEGDRRD